MPLKKIYFILPAILILAGAGCQKITITQSPEPEKNITIASPAAGETVALPFSVKGQARVFENQFNIRVKDSAGNILYEDGVVSDAQDAGLFGDYNKEINYFLKQPAGNDLILEAFDYSAKDGSVQDLVSVPVKINLGEAQKINLYFNSNKLDPQISCNKVFPVERVIPKTQTPATAALNLLLKGPSADEQNNEYFTSINADVKLQKLTIENGTAYADFDEQIQFQVGGSCRVSAIRAQITQTLKQFSTVKNVAISVDGRTEDILQP